MLRHRVLYGTIMGLLALGVLWVDARWFATTQPFLGLVLMGLGFAAAGEMVVLLEHAGLPSQKWFCRSGVAVIIGSPWILLLVPADLRPTTLAVAPLMTFVALGLAAFFLSAWNFTTPGGVTAALASVILTLFYIGVLGSFLGLLSWPRGPAALIPAASAQALLLTIFTAKTCDIGAYFTGRALGKHKLAPLLSPGKTWEGSIGGWISGVALAVGFSLVGQFVFGQPLLTPWAAAVFGALIALTAQVGDLVESLLKRDGGRKDASGNIPGFGGLLDVIDSILFAAPVSYTLLHLLVR